MIKLSDWDSLYRHTFNWVLRRLNPDCLKLYHDTENDWLEAMKAFGKVQHELFDRYAVNYKYYKKRRCIKGLELTADQLFEVFHRHLTNYTNKTVRYFIFKWWNDLRPYVDGEPKLDCPWELYKEATEEEIKQANKAFAHYEYDHYGEIQKSDHTFNKGIILEYRGIRFPVDDQWGSAWHIGKDGQIRCFTLEWDWWYPIDEYLDLGE